MATRRENSDTDLEAHYLEPQPVVQIWTPNGLRVTSSAMWKRASIFVSLCFVGLCFGGPGEIRTHDLFHAMEARSQLRHRPTVRYFHTISWRLRYHGRDAAIDGSRTSLGTALRIHEDRQPAPARAGRGNLRRSLRATSSARTRRSGPSPRCSTISTGRFIRSCPIIR